MIQEKSNFFLLFHLWIIQFFFLKTFKFYNKQQEAFSFISNINYNKRFFKSSIEVRQMQKSPLQIVYYKNKNIQQSQLHVRKTNELKNIQSSHINPNKSKIQAFCRQDGSSLSFYYYTNNDEKNESYFYCFISSILYYSPNGIKHKINIKDAKHCIDLYQKLNRVFKVINEYNDQFLIFQNQQISKEKTQEEQKTQSFIYKKYKIKQFTWEKAKIQKKQRQNSSAKSIDINSQNHRINQSGYQIRSNDLNAKLILLDDLYQIKVDYLQLCDDKQNKVKLLSGKTKINYSKPKPSQVNSTIEKNKDNDLQQYNQNQQACSDEQTQDNILSKYAFHPPKIQNYSNSNNRKTSSQKNILQKQYQISYKYQKVHKIFTIFNIPPRWYEPIRQIWSFLLINKLIKHQFLYIDFEQNGINVQKVTKTIKPLKILDITFSTEFFQNSNISSNENQNDLPILSKPKNIQPICQWIYFQNYSSQILNDYKPKIETKSRFNNEKTQDNDIQIYHKKQISVFSAWLNHESDMNILYDGYGYWHKNQQNSYIYYKKSNGSQSKSSNQNNQCEISSTNYHVSSIPLVTRIKPKQTLSKIIPRSKNNQFQTNLQEVQQPQRKMKPTLQAFVNYVDHNLKKSFHFRNENQQKIIKQKLQKNTQQLQMSNDSPYTEEVQGIGLFRAYPNEIVIGKFVDKIIMTFNGKKQLIQLVDEMGQKSQINLGKVNQNLTKNQYQTYKSFKTTNSFHNGKYKTNPYLKYQQHVMYMKQFHQKIFYPTQWEKKKHIQQQVKDLVQRNKIFRKFTELHNNSNSMQTITMMNDYNNPIKSSGYGQYKYKSKEFTQKKY